MTGPDDPSVQTPTPLPHPQPPIAIVNEPEWTTPPEPSHLSFPSPLRSSLLINTQHGAFVHQRDLGLLQHSPTWPAGRVVCLQSPQSTTERREDLRQFTGSCDCHKPALPSSLNGPAGRGQSRRPPLRHGQQHGMQGVVRDGHGRGWINIGVVGESWRKSVLVEIHLPHPSLPAMPHDMQKNPILRDKKVSVVNYSFSSD